MKTVDEIYQAIAGNIENAIKNEWREAELHIEVIGQMVSFTGTYADNAGGKGQIDVDEFDFQLTFDLLELHQITTEGGRNKWNRAIFRLESGRKFGMEFIFDQALQDEVEKLAKG
jgi:hypothetical protein